MGEANVSSIPAYSVSLLGLEMQWNLVMSGDNGDTEDNMRTFVIH